MFKQYFSIALLFLLAACSGSGSDQKTAFIGKWFDTNPENVTNSMEIEANGEVLLVKQHKTNQFTRPAFVNITVPATVKDGVMRLENSGSAPFTIDKATGHLKGLEGEFVRATPELEKKAKAAQARAEKPMANAFARPQ
ncbi:MAG TPA: hypothetical protein VIE65_12805 [Methylobacter sp.]|jgi:hypothetical protein